MQYDIQKIDSKRIILGWTRGKLAKLAGVSHTTITRIYRHGDIVKPETYKRLAEAVGLTMNDICIEEKNHEAINLR